MQDDTLQEQTQNLVQELRRGMIVLAVLSQLHEEQYGYSLMKLLEDQGMQVDQGHALPPAAPAGRTKAAGKQLAHGNLTPPPLLHAERSGAASPERNDRRMVPDQKHGR